jgi:hypothetical protein
MLVMVVVMVVVMMVVMVVMLFSHQVTVTHWGQ